RVDRIARAPLEAALQREDGLDLEVEMERIGGGLAKWKGVQVEVVGGPVQSEIELAQGGAQRRGQRGKLLGARSLEGRPVLARQDEQFERRACRVRGEHDAEIGLEDEPGSLAHLLVEHVAVDAPLPRLEVAAGALELALQLDGHDGKREQLRMRVGERSARDRAAVLEEDDAP